MTKIIKKIARSIAKKYFEIDSSNDFDQYILLDSWTKELENGWLFVANTKEFIKTGNDAHSAYHNVIVNKQDGGLFEFHSAVNQSGNIKRFNESCKKL